MSFKLITNINSTNSVDKNINVLNSKDSEINNLKSNKAEFKKLFVNDLHINHINSSNIISNSATITNINTNNILTNNLIIPSLISPSITIHNLNSSYIKSHYVYASFIVGKSLIINDLTANNISSTNFNTLKIIVPTANINKVDVNNLTVSTLINASQVACNTIDSQLTQSIKMNSSNIFSNYIYCNYVTTSTLFGNSTTTPNSSLNMQKLTSTSNFYSTTDVEYLGNITLPSSAGTLTSHSWITGPGSGTTTVSITDMSYKGQIIDNKVYLKLFTSFIATTTTGNLLRGYPRWTGLPAQFRPSSNIYMQCPCVVVTFYSLGSVTYYDHIIGVFAIDPFGNISFFHSPGTLHWEANTSLSNVSLTCNSFGVDMIYIL